MRRPLRALGPIFLALFVAVTVQSLVPSLVHAQQQEDVVYLKDGSVLRGTIIEDVPGESLRIQTRDGNVFRIAYDRIERRTRENAVAAAPPTTTPVQSQPRAQITDGRKSPGVAFILSFLLVGAGQGYNGQWGKALLMAGGAVSSIAIANAGADKCDPVFPDEDESCAQVVLGVVGALGFAIWSWIDAPVSASAINTRLDMGIVSAEFGPRPRLGLPSDDIVGRGLGRPTLPQVGISLARLSF